MLRLIGDSKLSVGVNVSVLGCLSLSTPDHAAVLCKYFNFSFSGDEILGATINFDQLSKEEVLEVLKLMEPFDDKIQVLTRNNLSKSLGNLDQYARDPETVENINCDIMLKDSYSKLYNAKVKRFMRGEEPNAEEGYVNGEVTGKPTIPGSSKVNLKHDTGLPRFGVDFGLLKSKTLSTDTDADSQFGARELTDGRNLNLPPFGLGLNGTSLNRAQESGLELDARSPQLKTPDFILSGRLPEDPNVSATAGMQLPNTDSPSVDLAMANLERPQIGLESNRTYKAPEIATNLKGLDVTTPKMGLNLDGGNITGPSLNTGVPQVSIEGTNHDFKMPKYKMPDLGLSGPHAQYSKRLKNPDLNVDDPSSYLESPNLVGVKTPDLSLKNPKVKGGISTPDINLPKASPQGPNLAADTPSVSIEGPSGKYKAPKFAMPKFDLPDIKVPSFNGELEGPNFKGAMAHPNVDVNVPSTDMNIKSPSGKLKIPGFGLSGSKVERPGYQLETPEMDVSALKGKGGINFPGVDLTDAKLNPNMPDVNMASSKFDIDANASSGKLKLPKFKLFGTLSKKKDVDVNAGITGPNLDLKSSDLDISGPNLSGGIKAPDINMPKIDLKAPKLDLNTQNVDLDMSSGKLKMPDVHAPDWDVSPRLGKVKMPKVNLSGTLPKGPNMDLNTDVNPPDWSGFDSPKLDMNPPDANIGFPDVNFKKPKMKMPKGPNVDINTDLQGPELSIPNVDINGPKGNLKMPDLNAPHLSLSGPKAKTPDMNLSGPKLKGPGISMPDLDLPNASFKGPKLDLNAKRPDLGINGGSDIDFGASLRPTNLDISPPNAKLNVKPAELKGNVTGPNVSAPNMDINMPKAAMRNPQLHLKYPNLDVDDPSLNFKGPSYKNRRSDMTGVNMKMPDLDVDADVRLRHTDRRSLRTQVRSSYPGLNDALGHHIDFHRSDLNIDDFTGKDHVLRARGSKLNLQAPHSYGQVISPSGGSIDMRDPRNARRIPANLVNPNARLPHFSQGSSIRVPNSSDGYYVTVFPNQTQNQRMPNRKYNTLGGLDFHPGNLDLEVPDGNDLKGSTFFFSNLV
uniref:Uncharacterized protein n=1 Tax=Stegastes partitus TaxID=144197 RepID=A0A3B4ZWX0_9TELE